MFNLGLPKNKVILNLGLPKTKVILNLGLKSFVIRAIKILNRVGTIIIII